MKMRGRSLFVLYLLALLLFACGLSTPVGRSLPPTVLIVAPVEGQQVPQGQETTILATASDAVGVVRVELGVDGVLLHTAENPSPVANAPFVAQVAWAPGGAGSHSVMAVAYNGAGVASAPAMIHVEVVAEGSTPATPGPAPTVTWTPIAVVSGESPVPPPLPTTTTPSPANSDTPPPPTASSQATPSGGGGGARPSSPGPITDLEQFGTWRRGDQANGTFTQSSEQAHGGSYSGKLAYTFSSGENDFVVFRQTHELGGQPNQISAWVYGDGSKHFLNVWIRDAKGEIWQFPLGQVKHTGWEKMTAWLDPGAPWPAGRIDGPANGAIDYPVDFWGLVLDDVPDSYVGSGVVYVDDLIGEAVSAPPPSPTAIPEPTSASSSVSFRADDYTVTSGNCTHVRWDVENAREVYLDGEGVVGHGERRVCPTAATTFRLRVVRLDGGADVYEVRIEVASP